MIKSYFAALLLLLTSSSAFAVTDTQYEAKELQKEKNEASQCKKTTRALVNEVHITLFTKFFMKEAEECDVVITAFKDTLKKTKNIQKDETHPLSEATRSELANTVLPWIINTTTKSCVATLNVYSAEVKKMTGNTNSKSDLEKLDLNGNFKSTIDQFEKIATEIEALGEKMPQGLKDEGLKELLTSTHDAIVKGVRNSNLQVALQTKNYRKQMAEVAQCK